MSKQFHLTVTIYVVIDADNEKDAGDRFRNEFEHMTTPNEGLSSHILDYDLVNTEEITDPI